MTKFIQSTFFNNYNRIGNYALYEFLIIKITRLGSEPMKSIELFGGIGGVALAAKWAGRSALYEPKLCRTYNGVPNGMEIKQ